MQVETDKMHNRALELELCTGDIITENKEQKVSDKFPQSAENSLKVAVISSVQVIVGSTTHVVPQNLNVDASARQPLKGVFVGQFESVGGNLQGPLTFDYANSTGNFPKLELNSNSWTKVANIIFIDQPAGSGYSYAKTSEAYNCNDTMAVTQSYEFLRKWLTDHPKYLKNPLYVSGDSYSGIFVALLTRKIYDGIEVGDKPRVNIKGYIQGNALTDEYIDLNGRVKYANHMGLISDKIYQSAKANCNGNYANVDPDNVLCLNDLQRVTRCLKNIRRAHILEPFCDLPFLTSILQETPTNVQSLFPIAGPWCREKNYIYSYIWANDKAVQEALNMREGTALEWVRCNDSMHYRGMKRTESYVFDVQSVIDDHQHLTSKTCRALIYRYKMKYSKNDYELTYATVKGAGHTAPEYKPEQCLAMVDRWFSDYPL